MVPDIASRAPMSVVQEVSPEDAAFAARWRQWQQQNAVISGTDARRVRFAFTAIFAALGIWLALLWLVPSLRS